jgi:ubiquinone biosynthesis protein
MAAMSFLLAFFIAINVVVFVVVFAGVVRRLLGLRFGRLRLLLAGGLAFGVSGPIMGSMFGVAARWDQGLGQFWFFVLAMAVSVLIAMIFLTAAEALVPTGSIQPLAWSRALRGRLARSRRYLQITGIAIRHGLAPYLRGGRRAVLEEPSSRARLARSLRQSLDEGGVTFVKLGQVLSTRRDLLPAEFVAELGQLQDQAAPAAWEQVAEVLTAELGGTVEDVFAEFDRRPLAAA